MPQTRTRQTIKSKPGIDPYIAGQLLRSPFVKIRKVPRMIIPKPIALVYNVALQKIIREQIVIAQQTLIQHLPALVADANYFRPENVRADSWSDDADKLLDAMQIGFNRTIDDVEFLAADIGQKTNSWHNRQWQRVMRKTVGIELFKNEPWLDDALKSFTKQNVALITNLTNETAGKIRQVTYNGIRAGKRAKTIAKEILTGTDLKAGVFRTAKTRAELIAVDQTLTFYGQLNELRQKGIGLTQYYWRNSQDERVRGNPAGPFKNSTYDHWTREGKKYSWEKPPADGAPGIPIRCRCYAEPVFDDLLLTNED